MVVDGSRRIAFEIVGPTEFEICFAEPVEVDADGSGIYRMESCGEYVACSLGDLVRVEAPSEGDEGMLLAREVVERSPRYTMKFFTASRVNFEVDKKVNVAAAIGAAEKMSMVLGQLCFDNGADGESGHLGSGLMQCPEHITDAAAALAWTQDMTAQALVRLSKKTLKAYSRELELRWSFHSIPELGVGRAPNMRGGANMHTAEKSSAEILTAMTGRAQRLVAQERHEEAIEQLIDDSLRGNPNSLTTLTWLLLKEGQCARALAIAHWSSDHCETLVKALHERWGDEDELVQAMLQQQSVNWRSNILLCELALGISTDTGHDFWSWNGDFDPECAVYPALAAYRAGRAKKARKIIAKVEPELRQQAEHILSDGADGAVGWFKDWCLDGLSLLAQIDTSTEGEAVCANEFAAHPLSGAEQWHATHKRNLATTELLMTGFTTPDSWFNVETASVFVGTRLPFHCDRGDDADCDGCTGCGRTPENWLSMSSANQDGDYLVFQMACSQEGAEAGIADGLIILFDQDAYESIDIDDGRLGFELQAVAPVVIGSLDAVVRESGHSWLMAGDATAVVDSAYFVSSMPCTQGRYDVVAWMGIDEQGTLSPVAVSVYGEGFRAALEWDVPGLGDLPDEVRRCVRGNADGTVLARIGDHQEYYAEVNSKLACEYPDHFQTSWQNQIITCADPESVREEMLEVISEDTAIGVIRLADALMLRGCQAEALWLLNAVNDRVGEFLAPDVQEHLAEIRTREPATFGAEI